MCTISDIRFISSSSLIPRQTTFTNSPTSEVLSYFFDSPSRRRFFETSRIFMIKNCFFSLLVYQLCVGNVGLNGQWNRLIEIPVEFFKTMNNL